MGDDVSTPMVSVPLADLLLVLRDAGSNPYAEHFGAYVTIEAIVEPPPTLLEVST